jgi:hypothetical protein
VVEASQSNLTCRVLSTTFPRDAQGTCVPEQLHIVYLRKARLALEPMPQAIPRPTRVTELQLFPLTEHSPLARCDAVPLKMCFPELHQAFDAGWWIRL